MAIEDVPAREAEAVDVAPALGPKRPGGGGPRVGIANGALFVTAALAPLPFGAVDPVSLSVLCCILAVGVIFAPMSSASRRGAAILFWMFGIIAAYAFVVHEQVSTSAWYARPDPIWAKAGAALGVPLQGTASMMKNQPLFALGNTIGCILGVCLGLVVGSDRQDARRVLWIVACSGGCYAAYGVFSAVFTPNDLLWLERPGYVGYATGTFVNRNTAATYFGCVGVIWLLLLLERARTKLPRSTTSMRKLFRHLTKRPRKDEIVMFGGLLLSLMALMMTGSRAGVIFSLIGMIAAGAVTLRSALPKTYGVRWLWIGGSIFALMLIQIFGGVVSRRFETSGFSDEGRFEVYGWMARAIQDRPLFGSGLGTFGTIIPTYRQVPPSMQGIWEMGHSTPLEMAVELGLPLTALVVVSVLAGIILLIRGAFVRRRDEIIPLAGALILSISVAHSCIDFSLQVPGLAIVVMIVTGICLAQSASSQKFDQLAKYHVAKHGLA